MRSESEDRVIIPTNDEYDGGCPKDAEELWERHAGLAHHLVDRFHKRYPDLSHATIAMMRCLEKWDEDKGVRFQVYMYSAIVYELVRAVQEEWRTQEPGPLIAPGKYNVHFEHTDFQENHAEQTQGGTTTGRGGGGIVPELYKAEQVHTQTPEEVIDARKNVRRLTLGVPEKYRKALNLMVREGYTQTEAAREIGVSSQAMSSMLQRRLKYLESFNNPGKHSTVRKRYPSDEYKKKKKKGKK
jgi:RNA polymerase sigma factor (sigma-70 family)